ncbi:hypothetical protein [Vibrio harveyi]|uniref:hypothetical protein n=1 Tax=Vibrio harveyi TaxID=669 RepID=UPI0030F69570
MANYIDGYYGHQSVTVEAIGIYNSVHLRAKRKLLKIKQEIERIGKENDNLIEFVKWDSISPIYKEKFYGLHLLEILKIDGEVIFPTIHGIKLHYLLRESYLNGANSR